MCGLDFRDLLMGYHQEHIYSWFACYSHKLEYVVSESL